LLIGIAIAVVPHRIRAHRSASGPVSYSAEGPWYFWSLRLGGLLLMAILLAELLPIPKLARWHLPLPHWLRWLGLCLGIGGAALAAWTLRRLGSNLTDTVVTRSQHELITDGPYRWVRHPFYLATLCLVLGMSLLTASSMLLAVGLLVFTLLMLRSHREEEHLVARFGDAYLNYRQDTPALVPRLGRRLPRA
jgi:protein-S-isoprenylcysteine O-methyltransferase Ste14